MKPDTRSTPLEPCPFCGCLAVITPQIGDSVATIGCTDDICIGHNIYPIRDKEDLEWAVSDWNKRSTRSERTAIAPPTEEEISAYRDLFRSELDKRMDTKHPSASPSTESHAIALHAFVAARNKAPK